MSLRGWLFRGASEPAPLALVLGEEPPEGTADTPITLRISAAALFLLPALHLVGVAFGAFGLRFAGVISFESSLTSVLLLAVILAAVSFQLSTFVRELTISEEGIRFRRLRGERTIRWWTITAVGMSEDLSSVVVYAGPQRTLLALDAADSVDRARVAVALRARQLARGADLRNESATPGVQRRLGGVVPTLAVIGVAIVAVYSGNILFASALGIRCSGPSSYFEERFSTPKGPGCVVIRVSSAAKRAGVRQGDKMIAMNGAPITSGRQYGARFLTEAGSGDFDFTFLRNGEPAPINIHVSFFGGSPPHEDDSDALTWFLRARGDLEQHIARDIDEYTRAIELAPEFDLAYAYRGHLYGLNGDPSSALADYQHALALNPDSPEANRRLGVFYAGAIFVDPSVARAYIDTALKLDGCADGFTDENLDCSQDYIALSVLGRIRVDQPGAIDAAQRAIPYYRASADPYSELALAYELIGDKASAATYARRYLDRPTSEHFESNGDRIRALLRRVEN